MSETPSKPTSLVVSELMSERRPSGPSGPPGGSPTRGFVRFLYTNNPFYVISAGLILWGLFRSFDAAGGFSETGPLMLSLAGYTVLLAVSAWFLIHVGQVWDDVRTILLLVVLMFLATSVTFDKTLATDPVLGQRHFFGGLALAIAISEGILRGIRLSMPVLFRLPYYLVLGLFFLYPVVLGQLGHGDNLALRWGLFGFTSVAGLCFLTLLPAIRRGPAYVAQNGSPWTWPLYPWVLFGLLGLAVCARAYLLTVSFHPVSGTASMFGAYFLVPFLLAVGVLVLEIGRTSRLTSVVSVAMIVPIALVVLASGGPRPEVAHLDFRPMLVDALGAGPLCLTLIGAATFYVVALLRRVPTAVDFLTAALAALVVCGPRTVDLDTLVAPQALPLVLIGLLQAAITLRAHSSARLLVAISCLMVAAAAVFRDEMPVAQSKLLAVHSALLTVLVIGAVFRDGFAQFLQDLGAVLLLGAGVTAMIAGPQWIGQPSPLLVSLYAGALVVVALGYGRLMRNRLYSGTAIGIAGCWVVVNGQQVYYQLRERLVGLDQIALGLIFFVVAMGISLYKAGLLKRWFHREPTEPKEVVEKLNPPSSP